MNQTLEIVATGLDFVNDFFKFLLVSYTGFLLLCLLYQLVLLTGPVIRSYESYARLYDREMQLKDYQIEVIRRELGYTKHLQVMKYEEGRESTYNKV